MLTLAYVPITCQEKLPDRSEFWYTKTLNFFRREISFRRKLAPVVEKGKILFREIVSVATNRRRLITSKKSKSALKEKKKGTGDDDEANASDVVSRDRRPSSSTTKAQHREATHKYIYVWARCVDVTIIFSPLIAGNRGRSFRFRFPLFHRYLRLLLLLLVLFFFLFVLFFSRNAQHHA